MSLKNLRNWTIFSLLEPKFISSIRMTVVYGSNGNEALIVTKDGNVYAVGTNASGCLGISSTQSTLIPKKIEILSIIGATTFACGKSPHVLALSKEGKVMSWGYSDHHQLGIGSISPMSSPTFVNKNLDTKIVVDIACGNIHSLALTADGEVYAWGQSITTEVRDLAIQTPKKMKLDEAVTHISCGDAFSVAITDQGEVYSWGTNSVGQLGLGNSTNQSHPCKITALSGIKIEKIVCGYTHVLALSDEGVLYVWGGNDHGQLGLHINTAYFWKPMKLEVPKMKRILDIAASHYNNISLAMGKDNKIFMWGQCLGQSIASPTLTQLECLSDAFALYAFPSVTYQPLILHDDEETNLVDSLKLAFDDPNTSDLIILVDKRAIHVHKIVLKIRCRYFRSMFQEPWAENNQSAIENEEFSYETYKSFLKYLYTNEIDLTSENALELLLLANVYSENNFKRRCIKMIKKLITVSNVAILYSASILYNAEELEECCFRFALNHMTEVTQTENFATLDECTFKKFITKAAQRGAFKT